MKFYCCTALKLIINSVESVMCNVMELKCVWKKFNANIDCNIHLSGLF